MEEYSSTILNFLKDPANDGTMSHTKDTWNMQLLSLFEMSILPARSHQCTCSVIILIVKDSKLVKNFIIYV